jgi:hypothetical protein
MDVAYIQSITIYVSYYTSYSILALDNIGYICNFITFTSKQLRQNSCEWYFLMSAVFDFLYINFGLFTKLVREQYGSTLQNINLAWCRIRVFLTWVLPCFATGYLVLAYIDRCLSTSTSTRFRPFSQIKVLPLHINLSNMIFNRTVLHYPVPMLIFYRCIVLSGQV